MIGLLQRVTSARLSVAGEELARIEHGLVVLAAVVDGDDARDAQRLAQRLLGYRVFADADGRMNLSLQDTNGGLLLVPQFTLAADTRRGRRPSFSKAAPPERAAELFAALAAAAQAQHHQVCCGRFGADMQVQLTNDGPVTFWLES